MKKKIIYVDFTFKHKRVSYLKYYILNKLLCFTQKFTSISNSKSTILSNNEKRKMLK